VIYVLDGEGVLEIGGEQLCCDRARASTCRAGTCALRSASP